MIRNLLRPLLPEYANETLDPFRRWLVSHWLRHDVVARRELQSLCYLRKALQTQYTIYPSSHVWHRIQARVKTSSTGVAISQGTSFWHAWVGGMILVFLAFALLWHVLPPGIVLRWTAQGKTPSVFRVYRAVSGQTANFQLIKEIDEPENHALEEARVYTFRDFLLVPGQDYLYRLEVIDQNGLTISQTISGKTINVWPGQLALTLALVLMMYGIRLAVQKPRLNSLAFG